MIKNVRRCAQCRTVQPRQLLVRIQHTEAGFVESLPGTYYPGRSLYLCPEIKCWQKALKNKGILAVHSLKGNVDPVGACIGSRGSRIHPIIDELKGEKIDVVRWSEDIGEFITNALSPAKVFQVQVNEEDCEAVIVVPDDQLSLAIGREGQNVRLAAQLTHYHLDIITESQLRQQKQEINQAMQEQFYDDEEGEEEAALASEEE